VITIMNPFPLIKIFAWIAIVALACSIFSNFWIPLLAGAVIMTLLAGLITPPRR
jgi:hypothetical protein